MPSTPKPTDLFPFVPERIVAWRRLPTAEVYDREGIFAYIDGAGEVYRMYDFRYVGVFRYVSPGDQEFLLEIFDMGSAEDAYGVFTVYHQGTDVKIGKGGYLRAGLLSFWQGRYFVCLSVDEPDEDFPSLATALAAELEPSIPDEGKLPAWLGRFPEENLIAQSRRYFHTHQSLNYHYFVHLENLLNLSEETDCLLGMFRGGAATYHQLWIHYPSVEAAQKGYTRFLKEYDAAPVEDRIGTRSRSSIVSATIEGSFVALGLDVPSAEIAERIKKQANEVLQELAK